MTVPNEAYWLVAQTGRTPIAVGAPGLAKSASIEAFSRSVDRHHYVMIGSLRDPADIGGYPYPGERVFEIPFSDLEDAGIDPFVIDAEVVEKPTKHAPGKGRRVFMRLIPPKWATDMWDTARKSILFIDELTTCPPAVQAALLRVIAEHVVGDLRLPDDTWILSAANPAGTAANGFELEAPMANRLCHLQWEMDWESWDYGMMNGGVFPQPKFPILPDNWRDHIGAAGSLVAAFRRKRPDLFSPEQNIDGTLKMERSKLCGAWPSPRAWHNASLSMAACLSVGINGETRKKILDGWVGEGASNEFDTWQRNLDLPDPEGLVQEFVDAAKNKRKPKYKHPNRPDKVMALLGGVTHVIGVNNTLPRWNAGMAIIEEAGEHEIDVALVCASGLVSKRPAGAKLSDRFMERFFTVLNKVHSLGFKGE